MKTKKTLKDTVLEQIVKLAEKNAVKSANTTCGWWDNQPKVPDSVKNLRKF